MVRLFLYFFTIKETHHPWSEYGQPCFFVFELGHCKEAKAGQRPKRKTPTPSLYILVVYFSHCRFFFFTATQCMIIARPASLSLSLFLLLPKSRLLLTPSLSRYRRWTSYIATKKKKDFSHLLEFQQHHFGHLHIVKEKKKIQPPGLSAFMRVVLCWFSNCWSVICTQHSYNKWFRAKLISIGEPKVRPWLSGIYTTSSSSLVLKILSVIVHKTSNQIMDRYWS